MIGTAFLAVAALAAAAALIKAGGALRRGHPPGQGLLFTLFLTLALACFLLSDAMQHREDQLYPDVGRLLSNIATLVAAFTILALLQTLTYPASTARPKIRRRAVALIVSVIVMAVLFRIAAPLPETLGDFGGLYRTRPALLGYITIFIVFLGTALAELLLLALRYARLAHHHRYLRAGLLMMMAGSAFGLVYLAEKAIYVLTQATALPAPFGSDQHCTSLVTPAQCAFSVTLPITAVLLIAIGATLPVWGPALTAPARWYRRSRTYRHLAPLWSALAGAFPQIALPTQSPGARIGRDGAFKLHRRIIEIDDGRLLLRPYLDPAVTRSARCAAQATGLTGDELNATVEAAEIAAALHAHAAGLPPGAACGGAQAAPEPAGPMDIDGEAAWLMRVADAFASSPLVREQAAALTGQTARQPET